MQIKQITNISKCTLINIQADEEHMEDKSRNKHSLACWLALNASSVQHLPWSKQERRGKRKVICRCLNPQRI